MGHGARSALVTAILRTLLQDLAAKADDPAQFLSLLNRHFHSIIETEQSIHFRLGVLSAYRPPSAQRRATHRGPSAAICRGSFDSSSVSLIERLEDKPGLGTVPRKARTGISVDRFAADDVFLLFTDGVFELMNPEGEEFGRERLRQTIERHLDEPAHTLTERVIEALD